ncbi:sensor histidine kinase [Ramlibacter sp. PS4R-6]|uniref:sensor histidine kinase n=1 Tax=Ramlibacter sp. PS4R-6 TaxID=3133438 RepID=UPI00309DE705
MALSLHTVPRKTFPSFLRDNAEEILSAWDEFASTVEHEGGELDMKGLRDHAAQILEAIAADMDRPQSPSAQEAKSRGEVVAITGARDTAAEAHAETRIGAGFAVGAMITEYRALRASVLRLWSHRTQRAELEDIEQITRFNEAIDQAIAESVSRYTRQTKRAGDLFIGILGHDIRNPLGTILMATEYLVRSGKLDAAAARPIRQSVQRISVLTEQVVDVTRGQAGRAMPIQRTRLDLADVAADIVIETRIRHPDADLVLAIGEGPFVAQWDGGRMGQLFSNLLANAVQYGARGEPIQLRLVRTGDTVTAEVRNRGRVIPPEDRRRIFEALARGTSGEEHRRPEGLGLGLYICREIVTAHGGTLDVASDAGEGTRFVASLPVVTGPDAVPAAQQAAS